MAYTCQLLVFNCAPITRIVVEADGCHDHGECSGACYKIRFSDHLSACCLRTNHTLFWKPDVHSRECVLVFFVAETQQIYYHNTPDNNNGVCIATTCLQYCDQTVSDRAVFISSPVRGRTVTGHARQCGHQSWRGSELTGWRVHSRARNIATQRDVISSPRLERDVFLKKIST